MITYTGTGIHACARACGDGRPCPLPPAPAAQSARPSPPNPATMRRMIAAGGDAGGLAAATLHPLLLPKAVSRRLSGRGAFLSAGALTCDFICKTLLFRLWAPAGAFHRHRVKSFRTTVRFVRLSTANTAAIGGSSHCSGRKRPRRWWCGAPFPRTTAAAGPQVPTAARLPASGHRPLGGYGTAVGRQAALHFLSATHAASPGGLRGGGRVCVGASAPARRARRPPASPFRVRPLPSPRCVRPFGPPACAAFGVAAPVSRCMLRLPQLFLMCLGLPNLPGPSGPRVVKQRAKIWKPSHRTSEKEMPQAALRGRTMPRIHNGLRPFSLHHTLRFSPPRQHPAFGGARPPPTPRTTRATSFHYVYLRLDFLCRLRRHAHATYGRHTIKKT